MVNLRTTLGFGVTVLAVLSVAPNAHAADLQTGDDTTAELICNYDPTGVVCEILCPYPGGGYGPAPVWLRGKFIVWTTQMTDDTIPQWGPYEGGVSTDLNC